MDTPKSPVFDDVSYFVEACRRGQFNVVKGMLEAMPELATCSDNLSWTPLHYAAHANHLDCVDFLLENGAKAIIDNKNGAGETALHSAVAKDFVSVILSLVRAGASLEIKNNSGLTPFDCAISDDARKALGGYDPEATANGGGFLMAKEESDSE